jgi:hypothetical protein
MSGCSLLQQNKLAEAESSRLTRGESSISEAPENGHRKSATLVETNTMMMNVPLHSEVMGTQPHNNQPKHE